MRVYYTVLFLSLRFSKLISDSIKKMIDTNLVEGQTIEIDKCHFNHITEFDMLKQDNGLRLVKKRK